MGPSHFNIIAFFIALALLASMPCVASAHTYDVRGFIATVGEQGGRVTHLEEGDAAPFAGTLMDVDATARFIALSKLQVDRCQIDIDRDVEITRAKLQLHVDQAETTLAATRQRYDMQRQFDADRISSLTTELARVSTVRTRESGRLNPLYFSGGVLVGALVTVALTFAVVAGSGR
jgi:hypothetical protein